MSQSTAPSPNAPSPERRKVADEAPGFMPLDEAQTLFEIAGEYLSQPDSTKVGIEIGKRLFQGNQVFNPVVNKQDLG